MARLCVAKNSRKLLSIHNSGKTVAIARTSIHGEWSSRWAFILAATGSAVGLGNIWKFPYIAGENGGGAFVLVYLLCVAVIGVPIMISEIMLGRRGRQSPINTMRTLAEEGGLSSNWRLIGALGIAAGFLILSYYSVIAGWTLAYTVGTVAGAFDGIGADGASAALGELLSDPVRLLGWHTLFMAMTMVVVARGVRGGLEKAVKFLMPGLFVLLLVLVGYAMNSDGFAEGLRFLFKPDFDKLTPNGVLAAMGQAFFSLSLGMGAIMIYGSYLSKEHSIAGAAVSIAIADTLVAILAGVAIFPLVFANGLAPASGPSLIFETLTVAFGQMPGGRLFGSLFFILLVFAAWTSAISLMEPAVTWLVENRGASRVSATVWVGGIIWALGIITVLSFNHWAFEFSIFGQAKSSGLFDILDILTTNFMLPLGGFFIAIFAAWRLSDSACREELALPEPVFQLWRFLARFVTPLGVMAIFLHSLGIVDLG